MANAMSAEGEVLSQDEVDALLQGVDNGAVDLSAAPVSGPVQTYNMAEHVRVVRGRMPALELINERFVRQLRTGLYALLRRTPEVNVAQVQSQRFSEYRQTLHMPTSMNQVRFNPLGGTALVVFDSRLVFALVDAFFGGIGGNAAIEGREFTPSESRVIQMLLRQVLADLQAAWSPVMPLRPEFVSAESNPMFLNSAAPGEVMIVTSFRIQIDGCGGEMHVTMPYSQIEPIRETLESGLQGESKAQDGDWSPQLRTHAGDMEVAIVPVLGQSTLTVEKLLSLKAGDMIPCDFEGDVTLYAEGVAAARGKYCASRGKQAVQVRELLLPSQG